MDERLYDIAELMRRDLQGLLSADEKKVLEGMLRDEPEYAALREQYRADGILHTDLHRLSQVDSAAAWANVKDQLDASGDVYTRVETRMPVHRVHLLKTAWVRYAAAVILLFGIGAYLWNIQTKEKPEVAKTDIPAPVKNDVAPGGNRATLTLAGGRTIHLDSAASGLLAREGTTTIEKTDDGQIHYRSAAAGAAAEVAMNTMTTPRGGQYQLVLPDGSRVWLNAASSIIYPTVFTGKERQVSITGEAYFEVAKNAAMPFRVQAGNETIEVLGTHFNVNAYSDEQSMKTSLLEGSVKVGSKVLKPGQAFINGEVVKTNVEQDVAWKNGYFSFNRSSLRTVLGQLSRWYDVQVIYADDSQSNKLVSGEMQRSLHLSEVLDILHRLGADLKIDNKTLIVL